MSIIRLHPSEGGDDYQISLYVNQQPTLNQQPTREIIVNKIKKEGGCVFDDYTITTL